MDERKTIGDIKTELFSSVNRGIMNEATALKLMQDAEREYYLSMHKYAVTYSSTGYWMTYLPDDQSKEGRIKKRKKTREELEDVIVDYWRTHTQVSMGDLILQWIDYKLQAGKKRNKFKQQTANRYTIDFHRFFDETKMLSMDVSTLTSAELEDFILERIDTLDLTAKAYSGMRTLLRGALNYYAKYNHLSFSPELFFKGLNLRPYFADPIIKKQVFSLKEIELINRYIAVHGESVISYGILFGFQTGMRVGEISALKWEDVFDGAVYVHRTEEVFRDEDGIYQYRVRDFPKSGAGIRDVILTPKAKEIIKRLKELGYSNEYVFAGEDGDRTKGDMFSNKLRRICIAVGIEPRTMHKARKTYASNLFRNHVDEALIISQMGHVDINTTKNFYRYNTQEDDKARDYIYNAINY